MSGEHLGDNMRKTETTRQKIKSILEYRPEPTPATIQDALSDDGIEIDRDQIVEEIKEINEDPEVIVKVAPAVCKECGFDGWDGLANIPSQCPECKSEWIEEPAFTI